MKGADGSSRASPGPRKAYLGVRCGFVAALLAAWASGGTAPLRHAVADARAPSDFTTDFVPAARFVLITGHNLSAEKDSLDHLPPLKGFLAKPFGWRKLADEIIRVWPDQAVRPMHKADATSL